MLGAVPPTARRVRTDMLDPAPEPQLHLYERPEPAPFEAGHAQSRRALCRTIILPVSPLKRVQACQILVCAVIHGDCEAIATEGVKFRCRAAPISKTLCRHPARRFTRHAAEVSTTQAT
ncbi:hypothetical protein CK216_27245 [Mesorhizobium sp. WSM3876]|nr:hypothetical protein CK216_27245 [Mesorhizobium sp. WSM3876]